MEKERMIYWPRYDNRNLVLKKGSEYYVHNVSGRYYTYDDDDDRMLGMWDASNFISKKEYRNKKLYKILED